MTVSTPPRRPNLEPDRDLEQRVADLEALIEEARRRARRRRARRGAGAVLLVAAGVASFIGFSGHGGGGAGTATTAHARASFRAGAALSAAVLAPPKCADASTSKVNSAGRAGRTFWVAVPRISTAHVPSTFTRFCGPATVSVRVHGQSLQIRSGYCNASPLNYWQYQLNVGLVGHAPSAPAKFLEFAARNPRALHGGTFPASAAMQLSGHAAATPIGVIGEGRRNWTAALFPRTIIQGTVTIAKSLRAGTFEFHLRDATRITGSWTCGEKPYNDH